MQCAQKRHVQRQAAFSDLLNDLSLPDAGGLCLCQQSPGCGRSGRSHSRRAAAPASRDPSPLSRCRGDQHDSDKIQPGDDQPDDRPPLDRPVVVIWIPPEHELDPIRDDGRRQRQRPRDHCRADHYQNGRRLRGMSNPPQRSCQRQRRRYQDDPTTTPSGRAGACSLGIADLDEASTDDYHAVVSSRR